jgi:hypothetical protein
MTVYGADGGSFAWEIVRSAGGYAGFTVERMVGGYRYTEAGERHTLSRDSAVDWLRVEAANRKGQRQ